MSGQAALGFRIAASIIFLLVVGAIGMYWLSHRAEPHPLVITAPSTPLPAVVPAPGQNPVLKVYVSGAVARPGVVDMRTGERVEDAIMLAGGALPEAELDNLNLAARVKDEQHIRVPRHGELAPGPNGQTGMAAKLNLNTATPAELDTLPGIGTAISAKIISYRQSQGGFRNVEELIQAKLVNQKTYDAIKDMVTAQ